jgi:hypothetical protein
MYVLHVQRNYIFIVNVSFFYSTSKTIFEFVKRQYLYESIQTLK